MKLKHLLAGFFLFFIISAGPVYASFSNIVAYGDSLTDNGSADGYGNGWYTDAWGKLWVQVVQEAYQAELYDYAYGGAMTNAYALDATLNGLSSQIGNLDIQSTVSGLSDTLFTVWAGANNALSGIFSGPISAEAAASVASAAANDIGSLLGTLASDSISAQNLLIMNLPDLGSTPSAYNGELSPYADYLSTFTEVFNSTLETIVSNFKDSNQDISVYYLDIYSLFDQFTEGSFIWEYMFWEDEFHPSNAGHALIAQAALDLLVDENPLPSAVPIPGGAVLMASGLLGLACFRRKQAA